MTELDLIKKLNNHNKEAINWLYDKYGDALYGIVLRIVVNVEVAEDVLQEVFVKIWKNGHTYDPKKARLFTWMLNIARNTALNKVQSKAYRNSKQNQPLENIVHTNKEKRTTTNENEIGLRGHVNNLDEKYRKVIELIYFQGYTQKEVSEHLEMPLGSVKSYVRIAIRELKKLFDYQKTIPLIIFIVSYTYG